MIHEWPLCFMRFFLFFFFLMVYNKSTEQNGSESLMSVRAHGLSGQTELRAPCCLCLRHEETKQAALDDAKEPNTSF